MMEIKGRLVWIFYLFFSCFLFLIFNLFHLQITQGRKYRELSDRIYHQRKEKLLAERGAIWDRKGTLLAFSEISSFLWVDWKNLRREGEKRVESLIDQYLPQIGESLGNNKETSWRRSFPPMKYELGKNFAQVLRKENLSHIMRVDNDFRRHYSFPFFTNILGAFSETEKKGLWGLEAVWDRFLRGRDGFIIYQKDAWGRTFPYPFYPRAEPEGGCDIYLTLDKDIMEISFEELKKGVEEFKAKKGSVLVLSCETGEVLAMVDYPLVDAEARFLRPYSLLWEFEPGSVFKFLIAALALESKDCDSFLMRKYDVSTGEIKIGKETIREYHNKKLGVLTFSDIFAFSSNCGVALLTSQLPLQDYYSLLLNFGFGCLTGIELEERRGYIPALELLKKGRKCSPHLYACNSFGQGLRVTLIQLACAYLAIANDGLLLRPYVIKEVKRGADTVLLKNRLVVRRVISEKTAKYLKEILASVCEKGTGRNAKIEGVSVCGKTGTGEKPYSQGRGYSEKAVTTFIGFFPKERPKYLVAVMLDEPIGPAAENSAVLFRRIGEKILFFSSLAGF
uniref:Penicillin-binding protein 2 n=1 Tax=candidate division WOR-3 bacterium TaxID=2052148 RepID=A0A7C3Z274_UNCW3